MPNSTFDLKGRTAIVTGASKGIGRSIAIALAAAGASVIVSSRKLEACETVVQEIRAQGNDAIARACHVGKAEDLQQIVKDCIDTWGRIDILVNNAATNPVFGFLAKAESDSFDHIMNVNVKGAMLLSNLCFPHMKSQGVGSIINIASVEGVKPSPGLGPYSISKAALIMLTKSQAIEWAGLGIRSNAICPGLIQTKFSQALWSNEGIFKEFIKQVPAGKMGQAQDMAGLALLLASEAGSYINGSVITADGGYLA